MFNVNPTLKAPTTSDTRDLCNTMGPPLLYTLYAVKGTLPATLLARLISWESLNTLFGLYFLYGLKGNCVYFVWFIVYSVWFKGEATRGSARHAATYSMGPGQAALGRSILPESCRMSSEFSESLDVKSAMRSSTLLPRILAMAWSGALFVFLTFFFLLFVFPGRPHLKVGWFTYSG